MTIESALFSLRPGARWTVFGETYDGIQWLDDSIMPTRQEVESMMSIPEPSPVPSVVPRWALREVCLIRGLIPAIETELQKLPEPDRSVAMNRWSEKPTIERPSPLITALQALLGWTNDYVDDLFRAAGQLGS
jgi:hypothetical protein